MHSTSLGASKSLTARLDGGYPTETHTLYRTHGIGEREALRTTRMLDSKLRTIGVDVGALEQGVHENTMKRQTMAEAAAAEADAARRVHEAASTLAAHVEAERKAALASTVSSWNANAPKSLRREWDLSDPAQVRKATLPRDTRPLYESRAPAPVSGLQTFDAEWLDDPSIPDEKRRQLLAALANGTAEMEAKRKAEEDERCADAEATAATVSAAIEIDALTRRGRAEERRALASTNRTLSAQRAAAEAAARAAEAAATVSHVAHEEANPFLREDTRAAAFADNPYRIRPDHFKGMSKPAVASVYAEVDRQMEERAQLRAAEEAATRAEQEALAAQAAAAASIASQQDAERAARTVAYYDSLRARAAEKREADAARRAEERAKQNPTASGILAGFGKSLK